MRADDLNSLTSATKKLKTMTNVPLKNKDGLVITQIMYLCKALEVVKVNA